MFRSARLLVSPVVFMLAALALALMFSCSDQPTAPAPKSEGLGGSGELDPGAGGSFLIGTVADTATGTETGFLEVWALNAAFDDSAGIASFDVQIRNRTARIFGLPVCFLITDIRPDDIAVVDFDGIMAGVPYYYISEALDGGRILEPGESSKPVTMKFHTGTPRSFAIGFRFGAGPLPLGKIAGVVFLDADKNGVMDRSCRCEPGIEGIVITLEKTLPNGNTEEVFTVTDSSGAYEFGWLGAGVYKVSVAMVENRYLVTSPNPLLVTLVRDADLRVQDFLGADFGLFPLTPPSSITLFGPIIMGTPCPLGLPVQFGPELDSTFVNPPSPPTVVYKYYLSMMNWSMEDRDPPWPDNGQIDSVSAWINNVLVFTYPPDSSFVPSGFPSHRGIQLPDGLVTEGENTIRLTLNGGPCAALFWEVFKRP